jgi:glycosyltransferase involved in cell wall biosynthesis
MNVTSDPLVSIVIPSYNHAHFLGRALQSLLDQTYTNWEVILVDNHSQDNTDKVVQSFAEQRIAMLKIHNNGVIAASRNMGILAARGEWIAFLDSDDFWYPEKLEISINGIQEDASVDVCSTDEMMVDEVSGKKRMLKYGPYCPDFYKELLLEGNCLSPSATLVRRDFLIRHGILFRENKEFVTAEDYDLWMRLAQAGAKFKFIHSVQGEYRVHAINSSGQIERHSQSVVSVARDHTFQQQCFQPDANKLWCKINARLMLAKARANIGRKQFVPGTHALMLAFRSSFSGSLWFIFSKFKKNILKALT